MPTNEKATTFFKKHTLPVLFVFLIPVLSLWFFHYAETRLDHDVLETINQEIDLDTTGTTAQKEKSRAFFEATPMSKIMASRSPEFAALQADFQPTQLRYATFRWMQRLAWLALATIIFTFLSVGLGIALSFRSHNALFWSLRIGWPVLRTSAFIEVISQGILATFLSFWVTAIFFNIYVIKLIAIIGIVAAVGIWALIKAIFRKIDNVSELTGESLASADAPTLWDRVRHLSATLETAPPDHIIVGIDANFFVTEHPVRLNGATLEGRTLYLSLPILKILSVEEADAVLGHELAHFSGNDTLWSRKISPLMGRFEIYLDSLFAGISVVVGHFMHLFWKLYMLSINGLSRKREFLADGIGGRLSSPAAMKRSLIKIAGYSDYRAKMVRSIFEQKQLNPELDLPRMLERGYPDSLKAFTGNAEAAFAEIPHPFDSHPPLNERLAHLGFESSAALQESTLHSPLTASWFDAIPRAAAIEDQLWNAHQEEIKTFHSQDLAWRLLPTNPEEEALVTAHFPERIFHDKKAAEVRLTYDRCEMTGWDAPIYYKDITKLLLSTSMFSKGLKITHTHPVTLKKKTVTLPVHKFRNSDGLLLPFFDQYYGRHKTAEARSQEK